MSKAAGWMAGRGWRGKLAKSGYYEQTLFDHSLIELDVLLELLTILAKPTHCTLTDTEQDILVAAVLAHDLGKETKDWQSYIIAPDNNKRVPHVIPELIRAAIPDLCSTLRLQDLEESVRQTMACCAEFHHSRPGRSDGLIFEAMLSGGSDRFLTLASLVKAIDHLCSASSAAEALEVGENEPALCNHVKFSRHEVLIRGISTTFLHHAAQTAFQQQGWRPLLFFTHSTLYGGEPKEEPLVPTAERIQELLQAEIDSAVSRDVTHLMVGSPTGNILPKPELFAFSEAKQYLRNAGAKIKPQSFARKKMADKRKVVENCWKLRGRKDKPTELQVEEEAGRISEAQPEMLVFKFFKAAMDPDKMEVIGEDGAALAMTLYEEIFGSGSWASLQSTSTLMPARDMVKTIDYYWSLPGRAVNRDVGKVSELPRETRIEALIELLDGISQKVYQSIARPSPREELSHNMAGSFIKDLLQPAAGGNIKDLCQKQMEHYSQSKPFAGKQGAKGMYLCPICNSPFNSQSARKASADFIDNPQAHTNRGISHGSFGYVTVCATCYYERLLLQILLGSRPAELITMLPRLNLGPGKGEQFVRKVKEWVNAAKSQMRGDAGSLESGYSLGLTDQIARNLGKRDPLTLDSQELLSMFSYRFAPETQKKRWQETLKRLREEFDGDLNNLNAACDQAFSTWEDAVNTLIKDGIAQQEFRAIRREVFRLYETIHLICETPNLVFVPLADEIASGKDESESSKGLRRLYVSLILGLVFNASVAIHRYGETVDFRGGAGVAYVPPVPAIRSLARYDWLPFPEAKRWLFAIGAASLLVRDTGIPARSALYQILSADPPERLVRRIEENRKQGHRPSLTQNHIELVQSIIAFQRKEDTHEIPD